MRLIVDIDAANDRGLRRRNQHCEQLNFRAVWRHIHSLDGNRCCGAVITIYFWFFGRNSRIGNLIDKLNVNATYVGKLGDVCAASNHNSLQ